MAKIGSQNRLLIPQDLTNLIGLSGKIGIFFDEDETTIYLDSLEKQGCCIAVRNLDNKNRICIPKKILELIKADYSSRFVITVRKGRIYLLKLESKT